MNWVKVVSFLLSEVRRNCYLLVGLGNTICRESPDKLQGTFETNIYVDADFAGGWGYEDPDDPCSVKSRTGYVIEVMGCPILCINTFVSVSIWLLWNIISALGDFRTPISVTSKSSYSNGFDGNVLSWDKASVVPSIAGFVRCVWNVPSGVLSKPIDCGLAAYPQSPKHHVLQYLHCVWHLLSLPMDDSFPWAAVSVHQDRY